MSHQRGRCLFEDRKIFHRAMVSKENLETGKNPLTCRCMTLPDLVPNYTLSGASVFVSKALAMDDPVFLQCTL